MSVLNGEPEKLSKKVGIPIAILSFSMSVLVWFIPNVPMMLKVFSTIMFPIASLMVIAWTNFDKDVK
jgi:hypothetical protein